MGECRERKSQEKKLRKKKSKTFFFREFYPGTFFPNSNFGTPRILCRQLWIYACYIHHKDLFNPDGRYLCSFYNHEVSRIFDFSELQNGFAWINWKWFIIPDEKALEEID